MDDLSWSSTSPMPRRRSMEHYSSPYRSLNPDDFADVFGGPPRTVLSRKYSSDFTSTISPPSHFYQEIFQLPEVVSATATEHKKRSGRSLPAFRIPAKGEGFYNDVFGSDEGWRSRDRSSNAKSMSNSSSVLSSEELSPHRPHVAGDDVAFSSFASKLRPINVPCRWNSTRMRPEDAKKREVPSFPSNSPSRADNYYMDNEYNAKFRGSYTRVSRQVSSPETVSIEPSSFRTIKVSVDDLELNSPPSPVSSLYQEPEASVGLERGANQEEEIEQGEDEVTSPYVIEINSDSKEANSEAISIDEAIAWAKEKFQSQSFEKQLKKDHSTESKERLRSHEFSDQMYGHRSTHSPTEEELTKWRSETGTENSEKDMEMELLDEDVRLWSAGKETNICLLLSTLHHILWPNSGWHATPLTSLIESFQVKKAYQKARLCLHPDKLQQRGATLYQKYVAEKAFSLLQDAWAAFITQGV